MPSPAAYLFDLDGTLADTLLDIAASTNHVRSHYDLPPLEAARVRSFLGDGARPLLARALGERLPDGEAAQAEAIDEAFEVYRAHHDGQCTELSRLFDGVAEHLTALRERGHPIGIVTNKPQRFAEPVVAHLGLRQWIDCLVGGDTLPHKKPDPAPLRHALEQLSADSARATMVGDGLPDLRAAKALGCHSIACLFGYGDPEKLRAVGADIYWRAFAIEA